MAYGPNYSNIAPPKIQFMIDIFINLLALRVYSRILLLVFTVCIISLQVRKTRLHNNLLTAALHLLFLIYCIYKLPIVFSCYLLLKRKTYFILCIKYLLLAFLHA